MQQGDYNSTSYFQYPQNPNPNPSPLPPPSYASAPPFATTAAAANYQYPATDYSPYSSTYPQNPNPTPPPTAPSFSSENPNSSSFLPSAASQPSPFPQFESHTPYTHESYYPPYDQHQSALNYGPPSSLPPNSDPNLGNFQYSSAHGNVISSVQPAYESPYRNSAKFDQSVPYVDETIRKYGGFGRSESDSGPDLYGKRSDAGMSRYDSGVSRYDSGGYGGDGYGDGVYAYQGSKEEPYGSRGTGVKSSMWKDQILFDDFGRPIGGKEQSASKKIAKAVPKADVHEDVKGGVQKFRVKLLAESGGQSAMDVLCQIGLDGIRMLDPSNGRTLRIYPLDNITGCEVVSPSIFAFWSKSSVDIESRRIRLQSNSYTTNTLLDTVTAATIQFKEMGGRSKPVDSVKVNEQPTEKKKGLGDWMNMMKPANEEKDHWVPDEAVSKCTSCGTDFNAFVRKHHCRNCGDIFCDKCTHGRIALTPEENAPQVRVCDRCMAEVTHRLINAKEAACRSDAVSQSHEDLAKKLKEEMERNRQTSSGSKSDGSGRRMKEVACPTCTVHLQVQVPSSGSETIECGVCQNPFLVSAH